MTLARAVIDRIEGSVLRRVGRLMDRFGWFAESTFGRPSGTVRGGVRGPGSDGPGAHIPLRDSLAFRLRPLLRRGSGRNPAPPSAAAVAEDAVAPAPIPPAPPPPPAVADATPTLTREQVEALFEDMVRPALQSDGGDIELVKVENNDVYVALTGACNTCASSVITMQMGIERLLREEFPHFGQLVRVE